MKNLKPYKGICYRFFSFEGAEKTLISSQLRLTRMDKLNDPFEGHSGKYLPAIEKQLVKNMAAKEFPYSLNKQRRYCSGHSVISKKITDNLDFETISKRTYTCSFSKNYKKENSYLMWSHYADDHKGICIGFNFEKHGEFGIFEVVYPKVLEVLEENDLSNGVINDQSINKFLSVSLFQKHNCWKCEDEIRLAFTKRIQEEFKVAHFIDDKGFLYVLLKNDMISTIIFGLNTDLEDKKKIKNIVKKGFQDVSLKEMYVTNKLELQCRNFSP